MSSAVRALAEATGWPSGLPEQDLQRICAAAGKPDPNLNASLFSRSGQTWRVNREAVLLAGGGRALLMQIAHPLVAEGVAQHSNFEKDPLGRLRRTLDLTLAIVFSDARGALGAVRAIEKRHAAVRGRLTESVGRFASGSSYDANDPDLLLWVHATLIDSALSTFQRFVAPLNLVEREAFYGESMTTARLFGIPEAAIPPTLHDFEAYMRRMLEGPDLDVGSAGQRIARSILDPPLPPVLRQVAGSGRILTEGLLPAPLRRRFGFEWSTRRERRLKAVEAFSRKTIPLLPARARFFPQALQAGAAAL